MVFEGVRNRALNVLALALSFFEQMNPDAGCCQLARADGLIVVWNWQRIFFRIQKVAQAKHWQQCVELNKLIQ
jgi:hypothetical protein